MPERSSQQDGLNGSSRLKSKDVVVLRPPGGVQRVSRTMPSYGSCDARDHLS